MEAQQMTQRGRKSAAFLTGPDVTGKPTRLTAPSSLTIAEQTLFNELTGACDSSHFRKSDIPLLVSFVQATLIAEAAAQDPETIAIWEKSTRLQATLATRLRLSPQSRVDPKTLGRQEQSNLRKPWEPIVNALKPPEEED
jgi:hypothetical protein